MKALPAHFAYLTSLRSLYISDNGLTELPKEIGKMVKLQNLIVRNNKLTVLPPEIGLLTDLIHLNVQGNKLRQLPLEIINTRVASSAGKAYLCKNPWATTIKNILREKGAPALFERMKDPKWKEQLREQMILDTKNQVLSE